MATNTSATSQNHNGTGSQANFAISFPFLLNSEIEVTVGGVLKTLGTHYNIVGSEVQFTSGNEPDSGVANVVFNRDTNISTKRVDFEDGSVLTEADLDNNVNQVLFAQQELSNDYVKRDGSQTITGNLVFEGSVDDTNETTLAITNPTADRTITIPDVTGSVVTTGDTGTVAHTMLANDAVDGDNIADDSINSEHYVGLSIDTEHIANENITTAKLENNAVSNSKLGDNAVDSRNYVDGSIDHEHLANDIIDGDNIQDDVINSEHYVAGSIDHEHLANDIIDGDNIQDDVINSEHYVAGSIDHEHLANDIIDGDNVQDNAINNEHIAANAVRVNEIKDGEITSAKLNPSAVITASEQASATTNDTSFLTSAAADARFFNISTGDTIKDGQTFPDNDTTIATTAAINDRIIDLIDDVGGFTIIASEQAFPDVNPQGVTGQAAVLSIKAATTNLVPSGTTVTITNGNVADNADITITGVTSTIPSGFGFLVESTSTLHRYSFHRLVPKATEVTTVAGKAVEIGRLGTADAVADMAILGTTDVVADMAILATNDVVADMNTLATADIVSDMNTLAVADVISDMDTVATNVTNVNNVGNNVTNVNSVSNSAGANQTFTVTVQNVSGNKYFIDGVQTPVLKLARGKTYTFDMSDSSNSGHPLAFRDSSDNSYTTGVTTSGTAGSSGATVVIVVAANAPSSLKYYCTSHGNAMGNTINVIDDNVGIVAGSITNVNEVGDDITNVNSVAGSISNVNTVATNISSVNSFANTYRIGANNPTDSLDVGDLFFNTTSDSLKVYTGSAWVDGVTQTGNFALKTGNTFTGSNVHNDNVKALFGTGSDLEIFHDGTNSVIRNTTGDLYIQDSLSGNIYIQAITNEASINAYGNDRVELYFNGNKKFQTASSGVSVTGNITVSGNVDGRDLAADGTKLDGIETGAINASNTAITNKLPLTGGTLTGDITISNLGPSIAFVDTNHNSDYRIKVQSGLWVVEDTTNNNAIRLSIDGTGKLGVGTTSPYTYSIATFESTNGITLQGSSQSRLLLRHTGGGTDLKMMDIQSSDGVMRFRTLDDNTTATNRLIITSDGHIDIPADNKKLRFGASQDLEIYFNGTQGIVNSGANNLLLLSNIVQISTPAGSKYFKGQSGVAELYYDDSKKFETTSSGATVTGTLTATSFSGDGSNLTGINTDLVSDTSPQLGANLDTNDKLIKFNDAVAGNNYSGARFGDDDDLWIYHTPGNLSVIRQNTSGKTLTIQNSGGNTLVETLGEFRVQSWEGENIAKFIRNGGVELYYNNSKKFETTSYGALLSGALAATGNIDCSSDTAKIRLGASQDLQVYHDGTHSYVQAYNTGNLYVGTTHNNAMLFVQNNTARWQLSTAGALLPEVNNTYDIGHPSYRVANIYTNDLNLSNEGSSNDVDGTWGSYTIQEGAEDLFLINKRNGKKYKFNLTEVA